jgi:hypothetical protein
MFANTRALRYIAYTRLHTDGFNRTTIKTGEGKMSFQSDGTTAAGIENLLSPGELLDKNDPQVAQLGFSSEGAFEGMAAWHAFCAQDPEGTLARARKKLLTPLKRCFALPLAAILALAGCGGGGGSSGAPISVAFSSNPPSAVVAGATAKIAASVSNDSANAGVSWSATCSSAPCGTFSPVSTASGADTTYTAPVTVPTSAIVTVTATSVSEPSKSAATTITINAAQPSGPLLSDGNYVYHYCGQDKNGLYFVAGAFTVKGGLITAGEQDFTDPGYYATDTLVAATSSLSQIGGNIQIILDTGDKTIGVNGVETLRGAVVSPARVLLSAFDTSASGSGALDLQTGASTPEGGFAFYASGSDQAGQGIAIGGVLSFAGGSLMPASSVFDLNDNMTTLLYQQGFASGTVSTADAFGRVTFDLVPSSSSGVKALTLTGYVNGTQIQLVESQGDALNAFTGGTALSQGTYAGAFTMSSPSVVGVSYAFGSSGMDNNGTTNLAGGLELNADGTVSGNMAINDIVNAFGFTISGGTYTVDASGRVTLSNVTSPSYVGTLGFQLYLDGNGNALELGVDTNEVTGAMAYAQTAASADFEGAFAFAAQGFWTASNTVYPAWSAAGITSISSETVSGFSDYSLQNANLSFSPTSNVALSGSENSTEGLLTLYGLNAGGFQAQSNYGYYPIDSTRVIAIQVDGQQTGQQGVMMLEAVQAK